MSPGTARSLGCSAFVLALTLFATWPQPLHLGSALAAHHDAQFGIWRLAWVAHALAHAPARLFDANIFHPATSTLAYSDATFLEGVLAAPLLWAGLPPTLVYNVLLLAGFAGSGLAMFLLARGLTGTTGPALVGAAIFTMLPYRLEHIMHLELQWAMFVPLTFWAWHRAAASLAYRDAAMAGLFLALQVLACVYYGAFLAMVLPAFVLLLVAIDTRQRVPRMAGLVALAVVVAVVIAVPFAWPYLEASRALGSRDLAEIARYSASPINYLASPSTNWLWGWTADTWGGPERRLFPGATALLLAAAATLRRPRGPVLLYGAMAALAFELSLGSNGSIYPWLADRVPALLGFRALSRFGIIVGCALAALAALGMAALRERLPGRLARLAVPVTLAAMVLEYGNRPMSLMPAEPAAPADVYKVLASAPPGVVLELPLPDVNRLPGWEPQYQLWSIWHWRPLINGYSGYYPRDYLDSVIRMVTFPDEGSMNRLRAHNVRYIVLHRELFAPGRYTSLMTRLAERTEFKAWGAYRDPVGRADLFEFVGP